MVAIKVFRYTSAYIGFFISITKTLINPIKKWGTELNREFTTDELRMARRHLRSCSTSLAIREMESKPRKILHPSQITPGSLGLSGP